MKKLFTILMLLTGWVTLAQTNQVPPNSNLNFSNVTYDYTFQVYQDLLIESIKAGRYSAASDSLLVKSIKFQMDAKGLTKKTSTYSMAGVPFRIYADWTVSVINNDLVQAMDKLDKAKKGIPLVQQMTIQNPAILTQILAFKGSMIPIDKVNLLLSPR